MLLRRAALLLALMLLAAAFAASARAATSLSQIPDVRGSRIGATAAGNGTGKSASVVGDLNGDGSADLVFGADGADFPGAQNQGAVYVFFGGNNLPGQLNPSSLNGSNGFAITGAGLPNNAGLGVAVSSAGDINGDGADDLLIGSNLSSFASGSQRSAFVLFGRPSGQSFPASLAINSVDGSAGFSISGEAAQDFFASSFSVAGGGDVNADGRDDVVLGAYNASYSGSARGKAYVVFGRATFPANINVADLNGSNGFQIISTQTLKRLGSAVAIGGVINNDSFADLMVNALGAAADPGTSYVIYGAASFPAQVSVDGLDGLNGFALVGVASAEGAGYPLAFVGDVNGDGPEDMLLTARGGTSDRGGAYVVYGSFAGFEASVSLSTLNGGNGYKINGQLGDRLGFDATRIGDTNADGLTDFMVVADAADPNGVSNAGRVYVVYGRLGTSATVDAASLDTATTGEIFFGTVAERGALSAGSGGKVDADGRADFVFGVPLGNEGYFVRTGRGNSVFRNGFEP